MNNEHLEKHAKILDEIGVECTLFFKRNKDFPIKDLKEVALYGNGVRHTIKGGTGSGSVNVKEFINVEDTFERAGIKVLTKDWLEKYDEILKNKKAEFIKMIKKEAREHRALAAAYAIGKVMYEKEYDNPVNVRGDVAIYVLTRNAGEGQDRSTKKGDFHLTDTEIKTILELNKIYKKFLLVLNVASVIDITPILEVNNILLLSQLGSNTSKTLLEIVLGEKNPSGKLATTWARIEDYLNANDFGHINETYYRDNIFVGYRYFLIFDKPYIYPFGYGLSYTDFKIEVKEYEQSANGLDITVKVTNTGDMAGKEVVQLYATKPSKEIKNPKKILVNFAKTEEIAPEKSSEVTLHLDLEELSTFMYETSNYSIQKGIYHLSVGNSCICDDVASFEIPEEIILKKVKGEEVDLPFEMLTHHEGELKPLKDHFVFDKTTFKEEFIEYRKYLGPRDELVNKLSVEEMINLACGDVKKGIKSLIGESCSSILGGAGETCLKVHSIPYSLAMCDGPAGIRLCSDLVISNGKKYPLSIDPITETVLDYLPKFLHRFANNKRNQKRKGEIVHQYATAIPVATALAQSFSTDVVRKAGEIIREEMEVFGVDLWLAPGMNIIRHVLCGRNFEYYSEDPYLTKICAAAVVEEVQKDPHKGVVIKHYACNNQEFNRTQNNSIVSMRALREIYISTFEYVIKHAKPVGIMTSYNLVNGVHASESSFLINDILRCEWGFKGLVMTDWIVTGQSFIKSAKNPTTHAYKNILGGNNLNMPGGRKDLKDLRKAYNKGLITKEDLINNSNIIYDTIKRFKSE